MKQKIVLIYVEALYMNYHRNAFLNSLIKNSKNWYKFNLSETFQDPLKQKNIIDLSKSADVLVVDTSVFSIAYKKIFNDATFYSNSFKPPPDYFDFIQTLMNISTPRVWLSYLDLHGDFNSLGVKVSDFQAITSYYYPNRFTPKSEIDLNFHDSWMDNYRTPEEGYNELLKIPVQIEMPFCLDYSEFKIYKPLKLWQLSIPGADYSRRLIARKNYNKSSNFRFDYLPRLIRKISSINYRLTKFKLPIKWSINFGRNFHHKLLSLSNAVYTDGSAYNYPVRKFFEIPAQRSLLLCTPYPGMKDRGYIDGKTHLVVDPNEINNFIKNINFKSKSINEIIENGYQTTLNSHNSDVRAKQIILAIEKFASGKLKSAIYFEGEYCYL